MAENPTTTQAEILPKIRNGWDEFNTYLKTLTIEQLTAPTDAAGWTAKDHVIHLAAWMDSISALLDHQPRYEALGVDQTTWETRDFDKINDDIWRLHRDKSWDEVLKTFQASYARLLGKIEPLSDADINRPYSDFQAGSSNDTPIFNYFASDTYEHYEQHQGWIAVIVATS